jgi:translation initiation factor IF-1
MQTSNVRSTATASRNAITASARRGAAMSHAKERATSHRSLSCSATASPADGRPHVSNIGHAIWEEHDMPKEEPLQFEGLVTEILPDARYRVQLDNGHLLVAYTAGRMKKNRIKTLAGDRVTVEVTPYDLEKGRLIFRHKDERAAPPNRPPQQGQFRRR